MVCSACGYENQVGNRFCGMCGTPLPHRPLTAPGAQGTHSLTRLPLENAKPSERQPAVAPTEDARVPAPPSRTDVLIEMHGAESRNSEAPQSVQTPKVREIVARQQPTSTDVPPGRDMVPEVPLDEYVKSFRYVPPTDSEEITMRGEAQVLKPQIPVETDAPVTAPAGTATAVDANSVPPAEDVRQRLGLENMLAEEHRDRPRFLDFSELPAPLEVPALRASTVTGPSILGLSDAPQIAAELAGKSEIAKPSRGSWRIWFAVAALLVFAVLGVLERRSQVNQTNDGPVEVIKTKIQNLRRGSSQTAQSAGPNDTNASKQEMQVQEPPKPQVQDQNDASNPNAPSSTNLNSPSAPDANAGTTAGNPSQNMTATSGDQSPAGQKTAPPAQIASVNGAQPAGQNAAQRKPTPSANTSNAVPTSVAADVARPAIEKPQPKPQAAHEDDQENTIVPGEEEMAKAKNASDSAAAAAWLAKAMAKGNPDAPVRLADMYIKGNGVPRRCEQALALLKKAATKDNAGACNRLASMYASGTCVERNRVEAYRWLSAALDADPDNHRAQQNRELIWRQMTPVERTAVEQYR